MQRRCIILGAGGFIGTNLRHGLERAGCEVLAVSRSFIHTGEAAAPKGKLLAVSTENMHFVDLKGATDVYYLASPMGSDFLSGHTDIQNQEISRLEGIFARLAENPSCRFTYFSSGGTVYGQAERVATPEDSPLIALDDYSRLKIASEQVILNHVKQCGLKAVILRVSNPYGPFQTAHKNKGLVARLMECALLGKEIQIVGGGTQLRDFIYIDDVISACLMLMRHDVNGEIFNVGSGIGLSVRDVIAAVEKCCRRPIAVKEVPGHVAIQSSALDTRRLSALTGWLPMTEFQSGLMATKAWWDANIHMLKNT